MQCYLVLNQCFGVMTSQAVAYPIRILSLSFAKCTSLCKTSLLSKMHRSLHNFKSVLKEDCVLGPFWDESENAGRQPLWIEAVSHQWKFRQHQMKIPATTFQKTIALMSLLGIGLRKQQHLMTAYMEIENKLYV